MQQRSSAKFSAASSAKPLHPKKAAPSAAGKAAASSNSAPAAAGKSTKAASPSAVAKKSAAKAAVSGAAAAAEAPGPPPVPTDREGMARVIYNHYNSFFPVDSSGKMRWQAIDDEYCLSFGAPDQLLLSARAFA
jgi:hypothetical protein